MMRRARSASTRWMAVVLRMCVVVAAWQGPIPWFHSHSSLAQAGDDLWLIEHLQAHHAAMPGCDHGWLGWHFHCDFPGSCGDDAQSPSDDARPTLPSPAVVECVVTSLAWESATQGLDTLNRGHDGPLSGLLPAGMRHPHFFDAFAPTLALPLRFGRLIC